MSVHPNSPTPRPHCQDQRPTVPFASFDRPAGVVTAALSAVRDRILAEDV
ncbi:hypothetical protein [Streptomyces sp. NPDC056165]